MWQSLWDSKAIHAAVIVLAIAVFMGWEFVIKAHRQEKQAYEGTITGTAEKRDWLSGRRKALEPNYRYYNYFWTIECTDGEVRRVEVPFTYWDNGEIGSPVVKYEGMRWPFVNTPEAAEERQLKREVLDSARKGMEEALGVE